VLSFKREKEANSALLNSSLFDEKTFYQIFIRDLNNCREEVIIESPFITRERMKVFRSLFNNLLRKGVKIYIFTRDPKEHEPKMAVQSEAEIANFERIGVQILISQGNHHRKLAILDRKILYEGSLNILSQAYSREIMRRIDSKVLTLEMFNFLKLENFL